MKNKKLIIIIGILIVLGIIAAVLVYYKTSAKDYVISVNNDKISTSEFKFNLEGFKVRMKTLNDLEYLGTASNIAKEWTAEYVINYTLGYQKAKEKGVSLTLQEINAINNNVQKIFSQPSEDLDLIKNSGLNMEEFKEIYIKINTAKKLKYSIINEIKNNITINDQEAKDYYEKNKDNYIYSEENVRARHILIKTTDENDNPLSQEKQAEAKKEAEAILARAKAGEDFANLAKEYSEDPGSKDNGGEYIFARGEMIQEFEDTAFSLNPGEISGLVKTKFGYHIIKLEEKYQKGQPMAYENVADAIKIDAQYDKMVEEWKKQSKIIRNDKIYNEL